MPDFRPQYDAIIAGAGPAGSTAAFFLGQAGWKVLVLEKERLPRYKPCGGGVSVHVLEQFPFSFDPVIESRVNQAVYALGNQQVRLPVQPDSICMVMRDRFDTYILHQARAEVRQGESLQSLTETPDGVQVETRNGGRYTARYLIGADGANSRTAHAAGLRRKRSLAAALELETPVSPALLRRFAGAPLFIFGEIRWGYLWVFPKAEHLSVGIAALRPRVHLRRKLDQVMDRLGISLNGARQHGHPIPIYTRKQKIATKRILLTGDAAGLVDPLTGEGIRFAIQSGRMAANALLDGQPAAYQAAIHRQIGASHRMGLWLSALFYSLPDACFELGVRNPLATGAFVDMLSGRIGYPRVIARLFTTLPLHMARSLKDLIRSGREA